MSSSNNFEKNSKPSEQMYKSLVDSIDFSIDKYYLEFMKNHDGAEGSIKSDKYIAIWPITDVLIINKQNEIISDWACYFCIGSDGSDQTYAFDKRDGSIVFIDPYQLGEDEPENCGNSFKVFLGEE